MKKSKIKKITQKPMFVIAIVGPTATGKSDFAVQIAKIFDGEVISADSRQVYKGLNIGTGKITKKEMLGVPHHGLDIADPKNTIKVFSASDFQSYAQNKIADISSRGKVPILCGGTGFYIDAVLGNISLSDVPPNPALRKRLEQISTPQLLSVLKRLNKNKWEKTDKLNRVRIIRAIEIEKGIRKSPSSKNTLTATPAYKILWIGLDASENTLKNLISKRLIKRIDRGMIREAINLHKKGLTYRRMFDLGLEYRYLSLYLQNKISKDEMITQLNSEIWQYVKRQRTWFRKNKDIIWIRRG